MSNSNEQSQSSSISAAELKAQQIEAGRVVFMAASARIQEAEGINFSASVPKVAQMMSDIVRDEAIDSNLKMASVAALAFAKDNWGKK